MRKKISVLLVLLMIAPVVLAINSQPISVPRVYPDKFMACTEQAKLYGVDSHDLDGVIAKYEWYLLKNFYGEGKVVDVRPEILNNPGTYIFTLNVTDDEGSWATQNVVLIVTSNPIPYIKELEYRAIGGPEVKERNFLIKGDIFQLEAIMESADNGEHYLWEYDENVLKIIGDGKLVSFEVISDSFQSKQKIEVSAFNTCGKQGNKMKIDLEMGSAGQNSAPESKIELPPKIFEGKSFQLLSSKSTTGQGFSEHKDKIVKWKWEITTLNGTVLDRSDTQNPSFQMDNSGNFVAHLLVTDSFGATGDSFEPFEAIEADNDPSVADASATSKTAIQSENFTLNASRSWDPDGTPDKAISRYEWKDMTFKEEICRSTKPVCVVVFNRPGVHKIRLTVFDAGVLGEDGIYSDIAINVISPTQDLTSESNNTSSNGQQKVSPTSRVQEAPIDVKKALEKTDSGKTEEFPASTKPAPGMEAIIAIIAIFAMAIIIKK